MPEPSADDLAAMFDRPVRWAPERRAFPLSLDVPASTALLPEKQPLLWARAWLRDCFDHPQHTTLVRWRGDTLVWRRGAWRQAGDEEVRRTVYLWAENAQLEDDKTGMGKPFNVNRSKVIDLLHAAYGLAAIDDEFEMPGLLRPMDLDPSHAMAVANGIVDLRTRWLLPLTPAFFSTSCAEFPFQNHPAQPKRWLEFLNQLWPDDKDAIRSLQEIFGYLLTSDTSAQKSFMFVGPKRSGKGTIARVLGALVGRDALSSPTLSGLSLPFGLAPMIGKRVAIVSDVRLSERADLATIAERILAISGEDTITIDRKHQAAWTGKLTTRFVLLTNELPHLRDASGALASRFVILTMSASFFGREDPGLFDRLQAELPGIFYWALDGLDRFRERGKFVEPKSSEEDRSELDRLTSPIGAFIADELVTDDPRAEVAISEAFGAWMVWCGRTGLKPGTEQKFGRDLRSALPHLGIRREQIGGTRARFYAGIRLR